MKKLFTLILLGLSVASCSGCAKKLPPPEVVEAGPPPTPTVQPPAPVDTKQLVQGDTWEFTLPSNDWFKPADVPADLNVYVNPELGNMVFFEEIYTQGASLDVIVLANLRGLKNGGATILSTKQVEVNGVKFVLVEASKTQKHVWTWMGVNNGIAYALSCGGEENKSHKDLCAGIAATLKLH